MSPEQAEGRPAGPEADVYSLALTLYECWSGENPHRRSNPAATARSIGARTRPLRRLRPDLPRELTETVDACLAAAAQPPARAWRNSEPRSRTPSTTWPTTRATISRRRSARGSACSPSPPSSVPGWRSATVPSSRAHLVSFQVSLERDPS